jgi:predicted NBD/HSP70 family sugar kinase
MKRSYKFLGSNTNLVKAHNLRALLMNLLYTEQISRVELAEKTWLSSTTITNLTSELLDEGIIVEDLSDAASEQRSVGRPRTMLKMVPDARYAVGVHIGIGLLRVAIVNLRAEMIANEILHYDADTTAGNVLGQVAETVERLVVGHGVERERLLGVGVGASGLVDYQTGVNVLAPRLGWRDVNVAHALETALDVPVCVDNNVRAMAIGEAFFGAGRDVNVLAFVYGRVGVGAGFVVNGQVFRGSGAGAGEIGHTIMLPEGGEPCRCGRSGCLETLIAEPVLVREAEALAAANPDGVLAQHLGGDARPVELIFEAARAGDEDVRKMIAARARYLGIALANLVNTLNPDLILLGGMFAEGHDLIVPPARAVMREMAFGGLGDKVRLQTTTFGWRAGVIGAASMALMNFFYQYPEGI